MKNYFNEFNTDDNEITDKANADLGRVSIDNHDDEMNESVVDTSQNDSTEPNTSDLLASDSNLDFDAADTQSMALNLNEEVLDHSLALTDSENNALLLDEYNDVLSNVGERDSKEQFYKKIKELSLDDLNDERKRLIEMGIIDDKSEGN